MIAIAPPLRVALLLCCAIVGSRAEQGDVPVVPPHHPGGGLPTPSVWGPQEVEAWLFAEGFGFLRDPFDSAQINGRTLLAMRDHTLDVEFNLEPSEHRSACVFTIAAPLASCARKLTLVVVSP
jgi:hypothetical protein